MWPATGPEEHIHAAAKRPNATAEIDGLPPGTEVHTVSKWFSRDLPYDWTVRFMTSLPCRARPLLRRVCLCR